MTRKPPGVLLLATTLSAGLLVSGCGGGGSTGDKAAFCRDNATLNAKSVKVTNKADTVKFFADNIATIDHFGKVAPSDIRGDAKKMVSAAHAVISNKNATLFENPPVAKSAATVNKYCAPAASTSTT